MHQSTALELGTHQRQQEGKEGSCSLAVPTTKCQESRTNCTRARAHTLAVVAGTGTASQASSTSKDASRFGAVGGQEKMTPPAAWLWSLLALRDVDTRHAYIKRLQSQVSLAVTNSLSGRYVLLTLLELYTQSPLSAVRLVAGLSTGSQPRISYNSTSCSERGSTTRRRTKSKT